MKNLKKILAVLLAVMMVAALSVTALASDPAKILDGDNKTGISDKPGTDGREHDDFDAVANTLQLDKAIVFINDDATNVYEPNITYTYTISKPNITAGEVTVTDEHSATPAHSVVVYDDYTLANVVTNSEQKATVTFADGNAFVNATANGTELKKHFTFTFAPAQFPHAGVFRFLITETVDTNAREIAGIVSAATYSATRYLDVYVRNGTSGLEIYGYVLFEASDKDQDITSTYTKSNGWVDTDTNTGDTVHSDVDTYTTYNAYVQKHVSGSLADQTNAFPFEITLANTATVTRKTKIRVAATDAKATVGSGTTTWTGTDSAQDSNAYIALNGSTNVVLGAFSSTANTIKHEGKIGLYGIPADTTIQVEEKNNTYDVYTASATVANGTGSAATKNIDYKALETDASYTTNKESGALQRTGHAKMTSVETFTAKKVIDFTNTITEVSPTGVALRIAPYALILAAGMMLLVLSRKSRKAED